MRILTFLTILSLVAAARSSAQQHWMDLAPGRPVRVTAPRNDLYRNMASFVGFDGDSLELRLIHASRYAGQWPNAG